MATTYKVSEVQIPNNNRSVVEAHFNTMAAGGWTLVTTYEVQSLAMGPQSVSVWSQQS